jgi:hypothetical protein
MIKSRQTNLVWRLREQAAENCIKNLGRGTFKKKSLVSENGWKELNSSATKCENIDWIKLAQDRFVWGIICAT